MNSEVTAQICRVYERHAWRQALGGIMRPGGLELTERLVNICKFSPRDKVADIGCGIGSSVEYLHSKGLDVVGLDPSAQLIRVCYQRAPDLLFIEATGDCLPLATGSYDGILAECSLSVMPNLDDVLAEIHRVLRQGGKVAVSDVYIRKVDGAVALGSLPLTSCLSGALPREMIAEKFAAHGFTVVVWEDCSPVWKGFLARVIMEYGSLEEFLGCSASGEMNSQRVASLIQSVKPGYFLMVAVKD